MKVKVIAHPNAKNPRIQKELDNILNIYVRNTAQEGKANNEILRALSTFYNIPKSSIKIISGTTSKIKMIEIKE